MTPLLSSLHFHMFIVPFYWLNQSFRCKIMVKLNPATSTRVQQTACWIMLTAEQLCLGQTTSLKTTDLRLTHVNKEMQLEPFKPFQRFLVCQERFCGGNATLCVTQILKSWMRYKWNSLKSSQINKQAATECIYEQMSTWLFLYII